MIAVLDGDNVPAPLFISSRLMAAFRLDGVGTFHLHNTGRDTEGRLNFHYLWESPDGAVLNEGTDFGSAVGAEVDYPAQMATWLSFIENDAEHYAYSHKMGTVADCDERGTCDLEYLAHAYQHSDEITMAHLDLTDGGDE